MPLLAACGDGSDPSPSGDATDAPSPAGSSAATTSAPGGGSSAGTSSAPAGGGIPTSDVPVGGGIVEAETVVTQPTQGDFKAFSAVCTHQGCLVSSVSDGFIVCPCHGSRFAIDTGDPTSDSLASAPLGTVAVSVSDGQIILG